MTDPTAAEVKLEAVRAADQRGVAAEACAVAAEQRAIPETVRQADAAAEEIAAAAARGRGEQA